MSTVSYEMRLRFRNVRIEWTARVDRRADHRHVGLRGLGRELLQALDAALSRGTDGRGDLRGHRGQREEAGEVEPDHAGRLDRAVAGRQVGAEHDRHLAVHLTGTPLADPALHSVDLLRQPHHALDDQEQRALVALSRRELAGQQADVFDGSRDERELLVGQVGEQGDGGQLGGRDHDGFSCESGLRDDRGSSRTPSTMSGAEVLT